MNILVCISKTPETTSKIEFTPDGKQFIEDGISFIMNPYDEWYALVKALEIKEELGGEVVVINVGPATNDTIIRKSLAIGADRAIRVDHEPINSLDTATQISHAIQDQQFDLIFTGKETISYNSSEVGSMLAAKLDIPFISYAVDMSIDDQSMIISREIEGGVEILRTNGPVVVSASKGLAEQRIPNMRGIMMAKRKPIDVVQPTDSGAIKNQYVQYDKPAGRTSCQYVEADDMDELIKLLSEQAKVI